MKKVLKSAYNVLPFKKELFSLLKLVYRPPESLYRHLHFKGVFTVNMEDKSFRMRHFGYRIENELFWAGLTGRYEKAIISLWIELCRSSNCIMDIGANTGVYALIAKTLNPHAKVYAFEPVKRVYERLRLNCELNKYDIICEESALSSCDGRGVIYDRDMEHIYSASLNKNMAGQDTNVIETEVKMFKLSTYIRQNNISKIDLMKIDVEMHEAEVLNGMEGYLGQMQPTILIEVLNEEVAMGVEEALRGKNYLYFCIDGKGKLCQVEHVGKGDFHNYLICTKEAAKNLMKTAYNQTNNYTK